MKFNYKILGLVLGLTVSTVFGQNKVTNIEGSKYEFTEVKHLDNTPVLSQGNTGTCWSFSAISFFESELMRMGVKDVPTLSQMYIVRKAYETKADKYVRYDGKINFSQGGAFHDIPFVMAKYGIVPNEVYIGLPKNQQTYNHTEMFNSLEAVMKGVLKSVEDSKGKGISNTWKTTVSNILDSYLGVEPTEFTYKGKKYTPKSYFESLNMNLNDYISLTSFTNHDLNKPCILEIQDNWLSGTSYNVSLDDLTNTVIEALKNGYTIAWGADVSEKGFSFKNGIAIAPADLSTITVSGKDNRNFSDAGADRTSNAFLEPVEELVITPELRQEGYDNKTTTDDHGMHIVGLYKDQNGKNYFLVKNSWGTANYPKGYLYVSENYFKWKTINIYLHKKGVPKTVMSKLGLLN
ncbi:MAG TPA: C1 family peptidase [Crocinitomicaceae bacterium]|nr:C1 family peptidase [Crocinitomicaceae bacterium]